MLRVRAAGRRYLMTWARVDNNPVVFDGAAGAFPGQVRGSARQSWGKQPLGSCGLYHLPLSLPSYRSPEHCPKAALVLPQGCPRAAYPRTA